LLSLVAQTIILGNKAGLELVLLSSAHLSFTQSLALFLNQGQYQHI
jgi:hypothetical protein